MENNMIIALIILAYIASVFLNRWLNYLIVKKYDEPKTPFFWVFSLFSTIVFIIVLLENVKFNTKFTNWFTGKHWKK
jgi:hypothetical protein